MSPSTSRDASASTTCHLSGPTLRPARSLSTLRGHGHPFTAYDHARLAFGVTASVVADGICTLGHSPKFQALPPFLFGQACPGARATVTRMGRLWPARTRKRPRRAPMVVRRARRPAPIRFARPRRAPRVCALPPATRGPDTTLPVPLAEQVRTRSPWPHPDGAAWRHI